MRWLFLFLMLANAIVLFWYATTQPRDEVEVQAAGNELGLTLVDEVPANQRIARVDPVRSGLEALAPAPSVSCFMIGATEDLMTAQRIMNFFSERGQEALINQQPEPRLVGYQLILAAPDGDAARLRMLDQLDRVGVVPESQMEAGRLQFVIGAFNTRAEVDAQSRRLKSMSLSPVVKPLEVNDWSYFVQVNGPFDHKMSNKISKIVRKAYPAIKIEKKLCKGVALPRGGH